MNQPGNVHSELAKEYKHSYISTQVIFADQMPTMWFIMLKSPQRSAQQSRDLVSPDGLHDASNATRSSWSSSGAEWREIDPGLLEERRGTVPSFPVDIMPPPWRAWLTDTAAATGAPMDYAAQALFAAVSGLCGAGAAVRVTPT